MNMQIKETDIFVKPFVVFYQKEAGYMCFVQVDWVLVWVEESNSQSIILD